MTIVRGFVIPYIDRKVEDKLFYVTVNQEKRMSGIAGHPYCILSSHLVSEVSFKIY